MTAFIRGALVEDNIALESIHTAAAMYGYKMLQLYEYEAWVWSEWAQILSEVLMITHTSPEYQPMQLKRQNNFESEQHRGFSVTWLVRQGKLLRGCRYAAE